MRYRSQLPRRLRGLGEPIERLIQTNIALVILQAAIIRLTLELADTDAGEPDTLVLLGIIAGSIGAGALVMILRRIIRRFPNRAVRIALAITSLTLQAVAFQVIHTYAS